MRLVVFPGAGNPDVEQYRGVYELLSREASARGYDHVDVSIRWPGHTLPGSPAAGTLTLDGAIRVGVDHVREQESIGGTYRLLARSFGTLVAANVVREVRPQHLERLVLWGPPPYWVLWKVFVADSEAQAAARAKGLRIDQGFFRSIRPFEIGVTEITCPTLIATGQNDPYCRPEFLEYLGSLTKAACNFSFRVVSGAHHEISASPPSGVDADIYRGVVGSYVETLLG